MEVKAEKIKLQSSILVTIKKLKTVDEYYNYIMNSELENDEKPKKKKKIVDKEIEHFKKTLIKDSFNASSVVKVQPLYSDEWINSICSLIKR